MTHYVKAQLRPKVPKGCCRCMCGQLVVKGGTFYEHLLFCPAMIAYAHEHHVEPKDLYTPHGWKLIV